MATPGRKQPCKGSRFNPVHGLGKQHKAVFKTVNVNVITQLEDSRKRGDVELNVRQERGRCSSGKGDLGCLEDSFDDMEAKPLVQPQGTAILGSDLERGTGQAVLAKSIQGMDQQRGSQAGASMLRCNSEILHGPSPQLVTKSLDRATEIHLALGSAMFH